MAGITKHQTNNSDRW